MLRLETKSDSYPSEGVYRNHFLSFIILLWREKEGLSYPDGMCDDAHQHPKPEKDSKLKPIWCELEYMCKSEDYLFGFKDIDNLRAWFYSDELLSVLKQNGMVINEYTVGERYHEGHTQVICHRDDMTYVGEYNLSLAS